jgi:hypothetical protein
MKIHVKMVDFIANKKNHLPFPTLKDETEVLELLVPSVIESEKMI